MPLHDWTRVIAGTFHDFHASWIIALKAALNAGLLPANYYALAEQIAGSLWPDVLTLQSADPADAEEPQSEGGGPVAVVPPRAQIITRTEMNRYARQQRSVVIRHTSEDRVVALIEIVSPGNKSNRHGIRAFLDKAVGVLERGIHLLLIDLFPPGRRDPRGMHGLVWGDLAEEPYQPPPGKPLTVASYLAAEEVVAYVEPVAVGDALPDVPLFLDAGAHVQVPLEATYQTAYATVPRRWRRALEPPT